MYKWINTTINAYLSTLIDCLITSPSNGQLLQYNGTKWINYTPTTLINANEAGTLTQMYGTYGGGLGGSGIAQNTYYIVPSYIDNSSGSYMLSNVAITNNNVSITAFNTSVYQVNHGNSGSYISYNSANYITNRININFSTSYKISKIVMSYNLSTSPSVNIYVYASNSNSSYIDTNLSSMTTDINLVLLGSYFGNEGTNSGGTGTIYSSDANNLYLYLHVFIVYNGGTGKVLSVTPYTGTITTSNLVSGTDYSIDSDPTTGNTRIKNLKSSTIQGNYNNLAIIWNELSRRIYPVIRDPNTIKLTDATHNITMSSTSSGYSIV